MDDLEYREKLKDPRWQKRRLQIFERDQWTCQLCSRTDLELHLHHLHRTTENPWEEPDLHLLTVCKACHDQQPANPHGGFKPPKRLYKTDAEWWKENRRGYNQQTQNDLDMRNVTGRTASEALRNLRKVEDRIHKQRLGFDNGNEDEWIKSPWK